MHSGTHLRDMVLAKHAPCLVLIIVHAVHACKVCRGETVSEHSAIQASVAGHLLGQQQMQRRQRGRIWIDRRCGTSGALTHHRSKILPLFEPQPLNVFPAIAICGWRVAVKAAQPPAFAMFSLQDVRALSMNGYVGGRASTHPIFCPTSVACLGSTDRSMAIA